MRAAYADSKKMRNTMAIGAVLACIAAFFVTRRWLEQFAEKVSLNPLYFIGGALLVLAIVLGVVVLNCLKIARENPLFPGRKVFFQRFHIVAEGFLSGRGYLAGGPGHLALEALLHRDVAGGGELVYLHAEVPGGGARLLFEVGEVGFIHPGEDAHHRQPELSVQQWI